MPDLAQRLAALSPERRKLLQELLGNPAPTPPEQPASAAPEIALEPLSSPQEAKNATRHFYDAVSARLESSEFGTFSLFLNYGYTPDGSIQESVVKLPERMLNRSGVQMVMELIGDCPIRGRDVLDVGCGRGGTVYVLRTWFAPRSVTGLDLSGRSLGFCRRTHSGPGFHFVQADAEQLPFRHGVFDVVTNIESSHSYPDAAAFYGEVARVLKTGGHFLYTDSMAADEARRKLESLAACGFEVERDRDITRNVLLSCDETAQHHQRAFGAGRGDQPTLAEFLAVPGSTVYENLRSGTWMYRMLRLRKMRESG